MESRYYDFYTFFTEVVYGWKSMSYNECEIYELAERVYKVFNYSAGKFAKDDRHLEELSTLDSNLLTVPVAKLYLDNLYSGFEMKYGGISLNNYLKTNNIEYDEKIDILKQIKNIILYLKSKGIVHGDLRFANTLYMNKKIRLTDLNGMIFPGEDPLRLNYLYYSWFQTINSPIFLDDLAFNLMTYLFLNYDEWELQGILDDSKGIRDDEIENILSVDKGLFDDEITDEVKAALMSDKVAMRHIRPNTFLLDHIKR